MSGLSKQRYEYFPLEALKDPTAGDELRARREELDVAASADPPTADTLFGKWLTETKANRSKQDRSAWLGSACRYILMAQQTAGILPPASPTTLNERPDSAAEHFHFAANELRRADLLDRSAQCYFNAALRARDATAATTTLSPSAKQTFDLGVRSAGRAESMFDSLGESEKANTAHALRLDLLRSLRRLEKGHLAYALLLLWGGLTRYGTSPSRWLGTLASALAGMTLVYGTLTTSIKPAPGALLQALLLHNDLGTNSVLTPFYLAVVNLFAFGGYTNMTPQSWLGELAILIQAIVSFFWLGTGVTFLTRR